MKILESWAEKVIDKDQVDLTINDLCFRPDGTQLIVAAGSRVLVYDPLDGSLIKALPGHKESIHCLSYAKDGSFFASGGADKMVIIWTSQLEGTLRFHHNDPIQALAFNPVTKVLLTCAITDFGLWSFKDKSVPKTRVGWRITCCSWTNDGQLMALGFYNGVVQIRDKSGEEKLKIERPDAANTPIWSIEWMPSKLGNDVLAVADWGQKLSFYLPNGKQAFKDRKLGFDPTQLSWQTLGEYLLIAGSNRQCGIYTNEGIKLQAIPERGSWVLCSKHKPNSNFIAIGCQDGTIVMYQLLISIVHGLYKERYAYRENMTDVIIQNLITEVKVRIKCRDLVKKLAVYKNRLAVQLPDKVVIYEIDSNDPKDMSYKGKKNISKRFECSLFVITSEHLVLCQDKRLECLNLKGEKVREWQMEFAVRYIRVIGGPAGKEGILVGLKSGHVFEIFVDSSFPVLLIKQSGAVRYVDISMRRQKLAVIDENLTLYVYDLQKSQPPSSSSSSSSSLSLSLSSSATTVAATPGNAMATSGNSGGSISSTLLFQEPNANSVAWNTCFEDMLAFSGSGSVSIICANFPAQRQRLQGFVVGFNGSNIFYLNVQAVSAIEIAHSDPMMQYIERKLFKEAYTVACLGVTSKDWEVLGVAALENNQLDVARKAFIKTQDYKYLNLIGMFQEMKRQGGGLKPDTLLAYVYAYQARFTEAAKAFRKAGDESLAMAMFTDLRMFDMAREYLGGAGGVSADTDKQAIMQKQAEWAIRNGDAKTAAELYMGARQYNRAIELAGKHGWPEMLLEIVRKLDKADRESLSKCGEHFKRMQLNNFAAEVYEKMGNIRELIELRMHAQQWDEVFALARKYPDLNNMAHYKYGQWLAENDRFEEAQKAFNEAGFKKEAIKVLEELTYNAVVESRFKDASYYYWLLAKEHLQVASDEPDDAVRATSLRRFDQYEQLAEIYYAYQHIHRFVVEPFTEHLPDTLFNASRYLLHALSKEPHVPVGISKFKILYTAAKMSKDIQAFKYARNVLERLDELVVGNKFSDDIELMSMNIKAKPFKDDEELLPLCYRCRHHNPLLNPKGNDCSNCGQPYVFSFATFVPLPLVEFVLPDDISDEEALTLIDYVPNSQFDKDAATRHREAAAAAVNTARSTANRLVIGDESPSVATHVKDAFMALVNKYSSNSGEYWPVIVTRDVLRAIDPTHVFISKWPSPLRWKFYKIILTNEPIVKCNYCNKFFHTDDFELYKLQKGHCPFCRRTKDNVAKEKEDNAST